MTTTLKISLQRCRQIMAIHTNTFLVSALCTFVGLGLLAIWNPNTIVRFDLSKNYISYISVVTLLYFATPLIVLIAHFLSENFRGVTEYKADVNKEKRLLFGLCGIIWVSIGAVIVIKVSGTNSFHMVDMAAQLVGLVSWYYLCKIIISYVKG